MLYRQMFALCFALAVAIRPAAAAAAADAADEDLEATMSRLNEMSLEELLEQPVSIASAAPLAARAAPGVLTVIDRDEIRRFGLRDLQDLLHMVNGFALAQDVQNVTSIGMRGLWAYEGKILVLIDGIELNEPLYATIPLGNRILLNNVERVEIIRGPGSVAYGGYAEMAVINVISRTAADLAGTTAQADYGVFAGGQKGGVVDMASRGYARRTLQLAYGGRLGPVGVGAALTVGQGNRSDQAFHDLAGSSSYRGVDGNASLAPSQLNLTLSYGTWQLRLLAERYKMTDRYANNLLLPRPVPLSFSTLASEVLGEIALLPRLSLTLRLVYKTQQPWHDTDRSAASLSFDFYDKRVDRLLTALRLNYAFLPDLAAVIGWQGTFDWAWVRRPFATATESLGNNYLLNGRSYVHYQDQAGFAQLAYTPSWLSLQVGARYEHHSAYGSAFVPRLAVIKTFGSIHIKGLVSQAFRFPGIENIAINPHIKPEKLLALELESGWRIDADNYLGANLFSFSMSHPMAYFVDASGGEHYENFPKNAVQGVEMEYRRRTPRALIRAGYSFYSTWHDDKVPIYRVPGNGSVNLGMPAHKLTAAVSVRTYANLYLALSSILLGPRYGYLETAAIARPTSPTLLANILLTYRDLGFPGLDLSFGLYNAFDGLLGSRFTYIEPYAYRDVPSGATGLGYRAPMPGLSREVLLRLNYALP